MNKFIKHKAIAVVFVLSMGLFASCESFFNPKQETDVVEENLYGDWYEYRSAMMGLYGLQQQMVEQLFILGELRGDLVEVTPNATADMIEVYNFEVNPKTNKYASPANFYQLIAATNRFIVNVRAKQPHVLDKSKPINNYDKIYGEALCMRAWAYFNAVRIYGKVPLIPESFASADEIDKFIDAGVGVQYFDQSQVIEYFIDELENKVKDVGVNHYSELQTVDKSWEVTIWSNWSWHTLLGHMYLTKSDYSKALTHFEAITKFNNSTDYRYQLDESFANLSWYTIHTGIDPKEHIYTLWFNKANQQQNTFQKMFETVSPHEYQLKPTRKAVHYWENTWREAQIRFMNERPDSTKVTFRGNPGDFYRGYGISYSYMKANEPLTAAEVYNMLYNKAIGEDRLVEEMMEGIDTVLYKYSIGKLPYDQDANYIIYRGAGVNLYMAEAFTRSSINNAVNIINNGSYYNTSGDRAQRGVRGRVGLFTSSDPQRFRVEDIIYIYDPFTNKYKSYINLTNNLTGKQLYLEEYIIDERARELAFEGERFYDLMRVAQRRNNPAFLASRVAEKYPAAMRDKIYNKLLDTKNWYINYFE
jgi:starch-binding outer membrane protein, SusD/RagB family